MSLSFTPSRASIRAAVRRALAEDVQWGDVTTQTLLTRPVPARATVTARERFVVAGVAVAREVLAEVDPSIRVVGGARDGAAVPKGGTIVLAEGDGRSLLLAERVLLNFLQHLSGIATITDRFCKAVQGYPTRIIDTRKTTPGLRVLEKWAVRLGGGHNHRHSLADGILIKDNHVALMRAAGQSLTDACRLARDRAPHPFRVIVEAQSMTEVHEALRGAADVILLDNMSPSQVRDAVALIKGRAVIEVSGGITLDTAREMAAAGAHYLSIGRLTHSAPAVDLSLDLIPRHQRKTRRR